MPSVPNPVPNPVAARLRTVTDDSRGWRRGGPYLSDRCWGTVREDYSTDGDAWRYLPDELSRSKACRWGEDGIAGIYDRFQLICFAPTFWNEFDTHLKDQLFGLTQPSGPLHDPDEFLDASGHRPVWGDTPRFRDDPQWRDELFFYEYFHDNTAANGSRHCQPADWKSSLAHGKRAPPHAG